METKSLEGTDDEIILERMIDRYGYVAVLDAMSRISYEKSEHILHNWQDTKLSKQWHHIGNVTEKFLITLPKL